MTICGEVIKTNGTIATIKTSRPASCEGCANAGICEKKELQIQAVNRVNAEEGDIVQVELQKDNKAIALLCYIFLVPALIFIFSLWLYSVQQLLALIAIPLIAVYIIILKKIDRTYKSVNNILSIQSKASDCN